MLEKRAKFSLIEVEALNIPVFKDNLFVDQNIKLSPGILESTINNIKMASKRAELHVDGDNSEFDLEAEIKSHPSSLYVKCFAIKADEPNDNGDYFSEEELKKSYSTFIGVPVFTNHNNTDAEQARGKVVHSWWDSNRNGIMIIARVDSEAYPQLARGIKENYIMSTSMGCWTGQSRVLMSDGRYIPIEEISAGDLVITHRGNIKPVINVQRHLDKENGPIVQLSVSGIPEVLECTTEHPFWVLKKQTKCSCGCGEDLPLINPKQRKTQFEKKYKRGHYQKTCLHIDQIKENYEFEWKKACDLTTNDFVSFPISKIEHSTNDSTIEKARLIGYFLAEGSYNKTKGQHDTVVFSLNIEEENSLGKEIIDLLNQVFPGTKNKSWVQRRDRNVFMIYLRDKKVASWFLKYCGEYSWGKRMHESCLYWPEDIQKHIVGAWLRGDGHRRQITKHNKIYQNYVGWTVSEHLRNQMVFILARFGIKSNTTVLVDGKSSSLRLAANMGSVSVCNGSSAKTRRPSYAISIGSDASSVIAPFTYANNFTSVTTRKRQFSSVLNYITFPITKISKRQGQEPVYNLEVADDHSYIVEGVAVKNCQVAYSICSICHQKAETPENYCSHIKDRKTRKISAKKVTCQYHKSGGDGPCPICGCGEGDPSKFEVTDKQAFEYNYGIKFIENSFVVNPACHECGVTEVIDPQIFLSKAADIQRRLPILLKAASQTEVMCSDRGCIKLAGQKELDSLGQALDLITSVSQSMLSQKDMLDLEFLSDLVKVLADLQEVTDVLTQQGYGRLGENSTATTESGEKVQNAVQTPSTSTPAPSPAPGRVSTGPAGEAGTVTSPLASKRLDMSKISGSVLLPAKTPEIENKIEQNTKSLLNLAFKISKKSK